MEFGMPFWTKYLVHVSKSCISIIFIPKSGTFMEFGMPFWTKYLVHVSKSCKFMIFIKICDFLVFISTARKPSRLISKNLSEC